MNSNSKLFFIFVGIALAVFLMFSYFQHKDGEVTELNLKLRQALELIQKHEKRYKTSHGNEIRYAASNRDLQKSLAKQSKHLNELSSQLESEKSKLSNAFLFYAHIKDAFEVAGGEDSHEQIVETKVLDAISEKVTQWKHVAKNCDVQKKNSSEALEKQAALKSELQSLHVSHRNLQEDYERTTKELSSLKVLYSLFLHNKNNITGVYESQLIKLQKQLEKCRQKNKNKKSKRTNVVHMMQTLSLPTKHSKASKAPESDIIRVLISKSITIPPLIELETGKRQVLSIVKPSRHSLADIINNNDRGQGKTTVETVTTSSSTLAKSIPKDTGHRKTADEIYGDFDGEAKHEPPHIDDHLDEHGLSVDLNLKRKNQTVVLGGITVVRASTILPRILSTRPTLTEKLVKTEGTIKSHFKSQKDIYQDFDGEPKHEPKHIVDVVDENGLSQRATAD